MRKRYALQCPKCKKTGLLRLSSGRGGRLSVRCSNCRTVLRCLIDRRPHPRRSPVPAVRVVTSSEERRDLTCELTDISATGCRLKTKNVPPERGQELKLEIRLPTKFSELQVPGSVVWASKAADNTYDVGISFSALDDRTTEAITSSPIFMSAQVSPKPRSDKEHHHGKLTGSVLNADKYKTGTPSSRPESTPPAGKASTGILNADRYAWNSFKKNLLNADRYSWKNPGSQILNGRKYSWKDTD